MSWWRARKSESSPPRDAALEQELRFFDVEYAIPSELIEGKQKVTVRFAAPAGSDIPGVFGIRMVRADQAR